MMVDIPFETQQDLKKLLTQLSKQCDEIQDDTMGVFYHDTQSTHDANGDPVDLNEMDISTLILAKRIKAQLKF